MGNSCGVLVFVPIHIIIVRFVKREIKDMSLTDISGPPQVPPTTTGEKAILEIMEFRLVQMKNLLTAGRINQTHLSILIHLLRSQMLKLYGKEFNVSQYLTPIREKINPVEAAERVSVLIDRAETFVHLVRNIGTLSFAERKPGRFSLVMAIHHYGGS